MSTWVNPALEAKPLNHGLTVVSWCMTDEKNTCKICPCVWGYTVSQYLRKTRPCGVPLIGLGARSEGIDMTTQGAYYELLPNGTPGSVLTKPAIAPIPIKITISFLYPDNSSEVFDWYDLELGTVTYFKGGRGSTGWTSGAQTWYESSWYQESTLGVSDYLLLAGPENPYPNGTFDEIYSDSSGIYDQVNPWVGPLPPEGTYVTLNVKEGQFSGTTGPSPGIFTNYSQTITSTVAAYGRDSVAFTHFDAGIPPYN